MQKTGQKITACCLAVMLLITFFPAGVLAADKPAVSLEQAIKTVKENFEIPPDYTNFTSAYNSFNNTRVWSLTWSAPQGTGAPGGSFNAQVDAGTGEVVNMNFLRPVKQPAQGVQIPAVSRTKALQTATDLLKRLAAKHLSELQPAPDNNQVIPLNYGPVTYSFRWQRLINGIPFPTDGVTIGINGTDGRVVNYNLNWTKASFPPATGAISAAKARQVFDDAGMLQLQYFLPSRIRPLTAGEKAPVKLVYQIHNPSNGVIDALTGKPLVPESGKWIQNYGLPGGKGGAEMGGADQASTPLSPAEQKEIAKTAKLISQDQAAAAVKKWLPIPDNMVLRDVGLGVDWQSPDIRIWSLSWNTTKPGAGEPQYISARVNAQTGELIGFNLPYPNGGLEQSGGMDRPAAQKMAEDFLKQVQPQRFQEVKLDDIVQQPAPMPMLKAGQNPPVQNFNYVRLINGIPFPGNGMTIAVDTVNKKIVSYNLNWPALNFPAPDGILGAKQAVDAFLKYRPLTLSYTQVFGPDGPGEARLVYQPLAEPGMLVSNLIDAKTGAPLDWQGKPISRSGAFHFNDIAGNFAEKEINLLGQAGIFGEYGDAFHPNEKITLISLLRAMLMVKNGVEPTRDLTDQEIIKQADDLGWLTEDQTPNATVSRLTLAKLMVRLLDLDRAARIKGIYVLPYKDAHAISPDATGYVALTWGLGIIKGDGSNFNPDHLTTRAEAAAALVRALEVKQ
ncbi:hypothetical protein A6M21_09330 [Desulfotomaculum copahuensis]|uniref:SLH domain-containing protein n=2 Tax=Desulfotomaculum copahuensis TaxID=1838280 RepID=A0A1B7LFI5_9FIRM|nr:hypothetical protein A6M21_09330 [Desulfotomaculum copahuensis]